jgi:undecaprenyl pyrophosphate phosphatase UppP
MDFLVPIVGTVTGIEMAQWKDIFIFALKVFIFTVPFVVIGLLVEKDVIRVPVLNRAVKSLVVFLFFLPVFLFGVLNYMAPGIHDAFWEKYPLLEGLWIMEGAWPPITLSGLALLYLLLYVVETLRGDLSN